MFKPLKPKGRKILTVYKVHFQWQKAETVRFRVKHGLWEFIYSVILLIYDNTDKTNTYFQPDSQNLLSESLKTKVLTVVNDLEPFTVERAVMDVSETIDC